MGLYALYCALDPVQKVVGALESSSVVEAHRVEELLGLQNKGSRPRDASRRRRFQGRLGAILGVVKFPSLCRGRIHCCEVDCSRCWVRHSRSPNSCQNAASKPRLFFWGIFWVGGPDKITTLAVSRLSVTQHLVAPAGSWESHSMLLIGCALWRAC